MAEASADPNRVSTIVRIVALAIGAGIPSLYLGFLTLLALWVAGLQILMKPGQAPDRGLLVLGGTGAAGLIGLWTLALVPPGRLRAGPMLRIVASIAVLAGAVLAVLCLSGRTLYGWNFETRQHAKFIYLLAAPVVTSMKLLWDAWRPLPPKAGAAKV